MTNDDRPYVPIDELTGWWGESKRLIEADLEAAAKRAKQAKPKPQPKAERTLIKTK